MSRKLTNENSSPYQTILASENHIAIHKDSYQFLNGQSQGDYESQQLERLELPTKNSRITQKDIHGDKTKQIAEKESDIAEILSYCKELPENQVRRMVTLKQFQDLLTSANPERTYDFMRRNYMESHDIQSFR